MSQKYVGKHVNTTQKKRKVWLLVLGVLLLIIVAALVWALGKSPAGLQNETIPNDATNPTEEIHVVTWAEFEAMTPEEKETFYNSFPSPEDYLVWMEGSMKAAEEADLPWNNGGKQPDAYTWEEYEELTSEQKTAFQAAFDSNDTFLAWLDRENPEDEIIEVLMPWENGGKQPNEYSMEEFKALNLTQQERFIESFGSQDAFEQWLEFAESKINKPWENGGKQPDQYTWEEFTELSAEQQEAFYNSFASPDLFDRWMEVNMPKENEADPQETTPEETYVPETVAPSELPWVNGGKQPSEYTFEEFDMLSEELKNAFYESFGSSDAFIAWMDQVIQ